MNAIQAEFPRIVRAVVLTNDGSMVFKFVIPPEECPPPASNLNSGTSTLNASWMISTHCRTVLRRRLDEIPSRHPCRFVEKIPLISYDKNVNAYFE